MKHLALLGGTPAIKQPFRAYHSLGMAEEEAVTRVVRSGCLSGFYGSWGEGFLGGPEVRAFEEEWSEKFQVAHTVSVNSATSGLMAAVGAAGVGPGDEIIVPATSMSATAVAPLIYGGIPVFADVDAKTFCIDLESVHKNLSEKTRAILAVNLFGQAAPLSALRALCDERGMVLIEDNAQGPLATENGRYTGTIGHIGVFSLNYHKHIHTGEGGMCTTDDDRLANRMRMIRNHAEAVVEEAGVEDLDNMLGFNMRLTELSAAVGRIQLAAIEDHVQRRESFASNLSRAVGSQETIRPPHIRSDCRHVFYVWAMRFNSHPLGISRDTFVTALRAEGVPCFAGYVAPLYLLPIFRNRIAIGQHGFPFSLSKRRYMPGQCPVAERLYAQELIGVEPCAWDFTADDAEQIAEAFTKIHDCRHDLAQWESVNPKETARRGHETTDHRQH